MHAAGELPEAPLSPSNEEHAFRQIAAQIDILLAAYPTTIEEDEYALSATTAHGKKKPQQTRRMAAVCAVLLEKRLLASTLGALSAMVQAYTMSGGEGERAGAEAPARRSGRGRRRKRRPAKTEL